MDQLCGKSWNTWKGQKHLDSHLKIAYGNTNIYLESAGNKGLHPSLSWMGSRGAGSGPASLSRTARQQHQQIFPRRAAACPPHTHTRHACLPGDDWLPSTCFLMWPLSSQRGQIISLGSISSDLSLAWTRPGLHIILLGQVGQRQLLVMEEAQEGPLKTHSGKGLYL